MLSAWRSGELVLADQDRDLEQVHALRAVWDSDQTLNARKDLEEAWRQVFERAERALGEHVLKPCKKRLVMFTLLQV